MNPDLPYLAEAVGLPEVVSGELRLTTDAGTVACPVTPAQAAKALLLAGMPSRAMILRNGARTRLLWLRPASEPPRLSTEQAVAEVFARWGGLLRRLD